MPRLVCAHQAADSVFALGRPIRSSLLPYSTVVGARPPIDSLDAISVFEAKAVDCCAYARPGHRVEGFDIRIILLGVSVRVPLTDTLDSSPRVSIRALALEWRLCFCDRASVGARERPRRGSPRALEGVFDSFEGYIA